MSRLGCKSTWPVSGCPRRHQGLRSLAPLTETRTGSDRQGGTGRGRTLVGSTTTAGSQQIGSGRMAGGLAATGIENERDRHLGTAPAQWPVITGRNDTPCMSSLCLVLLRFCTDWMPFVTYLAQYITCSGARQAIIEALRGWQLQLLFAHLHCIAGSKDLCWKSFAQCSASVMVQSTCDLQDRESLT